MVCGRWWRDAPDRLPFFGIGWILDLSSIYFGIMTDKKKSLLLPVEGKGKKLIILPIGIIINAIYFKIYLSVITGF